MAVKTISSGSYSPDISEKVIFCDTAKNKITIILPNIAESGLNNLEDYGFYIVDSGNNASVNNITIIAGGVQKVNSLKSLSISSDGGVASISVASLYDWVCNISYTQSTKASLVQIPQTNILKYPINPEWVNEKVQQSGLKVKVTGGAVFKYNDTLFQSPYWWLSGPPVVW